MDNPLVGLGKRRSEDPTESACFKAPFNDETAGLSPGESTVPLPVLGLASYTFRRFTRHQVIRFLQQLNLAELSAKDVKDHLPMSPAQQAMALADYTANGIRLHAIGAVHFLKIEKGDIQRRFEYCKSAGVSMMVAADPTPEMLPHIERLVREYDIRVAIHNEGPVDSLWHARSLGGAVRGLAALLAGRSSRRRHISPIDVLKTLRDLDPRIGCCIDVGHTLRGETDVIDAIYAAGTRLFNVHMKDLTDVKSKRSEVAVGEGIMPVRRIFEALIAMRYDGFVDLEYEICPENPMPGVIASFICMRKELAKAALRLGA